MKLDARAVLSSIEPVRFGRLLELARRAAPALGWDGRPDELGFDERSVREAMSAGDVDLGAAWESIFDPWVGAWVGGDLHDARRGYHHLWEPSRRSAELLYQPVRMYAACGDRLTRAWDFCWFSEGAHRIRGLVGSRAHVGFALPGGGLCWVAEESDGAFSVHVERAVARGELYDIRGLVVAFEGEALVVRAASDWRYHRVRRGAVGRDGGDDPGCSP